jgi:predicted phosphodiesterase
MRLAILADIHGNLAAFEAALAHARSQQVDQIIIAGDIVIGSPDSAACWRLARSLGCPIIRGNHERYILDLYSERADPRWASAQFAPLQWAHAQLSAAERAELAALPTQLRLPEHPELVIVHASLRNDSDSLRAHTPEAELAAMFPNPQAELIVRAHNHIGALRSWDGRQIITAGSVGLPLDGAPTAQYLILERRRSGWHAAHQSAPYDLDGALARFQQSGYLAETGPLGYLYMREVATASFQIVPFLKAYQRWQAAAPISLEAALARFLAE